MFAVRRPIEWERLNVDRNRQPQGSTGVCIVFEEYDEAVEFAGAAEDVLELAT